MSVRRERVNDMIRISPVRCIGPDNEQYGVIDLEEAKRMAREEGLDLVEVSSGSRPPVCRIMDYGKFKYQQSKKEHKAKSGSKKTELKEIRLGRSMRIDPHDVKMRLNQARAFLLGGNKVQFIQPFQGREMQHKQAGFVRMKEIEEYLADIAKVEMSPRFNGRRMVMIMAPDKIKIQSRKSDNTSRKKEKAEKVNEAEDNTGEPQETSEPAQSSTDSEDSTTSPISVDH